MGIWKNFFGRAIHIMSSDSLLANAYNPFLLLEVQAFKIPTKRSGELEAIYEHETLLKKREHLRMGN